MSTIQDLQKMSDAQLQKMLAEKQSELHHLRFQSGNGQLKNVRTIRVARNAIAQLLTEINQRAKAHQS